MSFQRAGSILNQTYRLDRLLRAGSTGNVYAALHLHLQREVAVKILHREVAQLGVPLERFRREAQIASQLGHPGIQSVLDFNFTEDGAPYMVMERLSGETLAERLTRGPLSLPETCALFQELCGALHAVHEAGVVHRDLKPESVFLPAPDSEDTDLGAAGGAHKGAARVKILDFGVGKIRDRNSGADLTGPQALGTPSYVAPEQIIGAAREADRRADVFALGAILYECLTGQKAFDGPNAAAIMHQVVSGPPPRPSDRLPGLPPAVDRIIARACARAPAERFDNARELADALAQAAAMAAPLPEPLLEARAPGAGGPGDGDTLFDAPLEELRRASREARLVEAPPSVPPVKDALPPRPTDPGRETLIDERADGSATVFDVSRPRPYPRSLERPTALLERLPITGANALRPAHAEITDRRTAPAERRRWTLTLATALLAVLAGVVIGMMLLKLLARNESPSIALERTQQVEQLLSEGETLIQQARCPEAVQRLSIALIMDPDNVRARQLLLRCRRPP